VAPPEGPGDWLLAWFVELSTRRTWLVVAGMAGGAMIPAPIGFAEIEAWARLTDSRPSPWEVQTLLAMDEAWRAAHAGAKSGTQHQGLGEYCRGEHIEECRKQFGGGLERICSTCPN